MINVWLNQSLYTNNNNNNNNNSNRHKNETKRNSIINFFLGLVNDLYQVQTNDVKNQFGRNHKFCDFTGLMPHSTQNQWLYRHFPPFHFSLQMKISRKVWKCPTVSVSNCPQKVNPTALVRRIYWRIIAVCPQKSETR